MVEEDYLYSQEANESQNRLHPITSVKASLEYAIQGLNGAIRYPFLAKPAKDRLDKASQILKRLVGDKNIELLIWDAYRTPETQGYIFNRSGWKSEFVNNVSNVFSSRAKLEPGKFNII